MLEPVLRTVTYAVLALAATGVAAIFGRDVWTTDSALGLSGAGAGVTSVVMGLLLAGVTIAASRAFVRTSAWARALHADLRPAVTDAPSSGLAMMALAGGIGEELVFRGFLVPLVGIVLSSLAFGVLHQVRGRARWAWAAWATLTGFALSAIFVLTGTLVGPIVAHVAINFVNLRHLRDNDVADASRALAPRSPKWKTRAWLSR